MKEVNIYVETDIPPMKSCKGRAIYVLETILSSGPRTKDGLVEMERATQNRITLEALEESLERIKEPCYITVWTDCGYVAGALNNHWPEKWSQNGWKNSKGREICDVASWQAIAEHIKKHTIRAMPNKGTTYQNWMQTELKRANKDTFWRR